MAYILFGNKTWVIRLPAFFAGILLVPASYLLIRSFYNKHAALLTAGSVASSSLLIEYSTNARGYTLICLFFLLILTLAKYLKENRNSFAWLLFAALSTIGFYTIPVMLYPFGVVVVWFLLSITFKDTNLNPSLLLKDLFSALIMIALFTFMLYLPVLIISGLESVIGNKFVTPQPWSSLVTQFTALLHLVWKKWNRDIPIGIDIVFISGFFISLAFHKRLTTQCIPIILAVPIWCIPILTVQRIVPPERVWLFLLPLYIGAASSGVSYILKRVESKIGLTSSRCTYSKPGESIGNSISIILSLALSLLLSFNVIHNKSIYYSDEGGPLRDAEEITIFLKNYLMPGDRVMVTGVSDSLLEYYFNLHGLPVRHLYLNLDFSHRILAVVNKSENQTIEKVLNEAGLSTTGFSIPRVIKQYPSAALYEIKRYDIYPHHKT
ncbi:MAG: glycosyltransferase family 39 protein [Nitrospinae bacterium]|nr:glycosyltransferase family 39 protein [Nitrospinota bacterium]